MWYVSKTWCITNNLIWYKIMDPHNFKIPSAYLQSSAHSNMSPTVNTWNKTFEPLCHHLHFNISSDNRRRCSIHTTPVTKVHHVPVSVKIHTRRLEHEGINTCCLSIRYFVGFLLFLFCFNFLLNGWTEEYSKAIVLKVARTYGAVWCGVEVKKGNHTGCTQLLNVSIDFYIFIVFWEKNCPAKNSNPKLGGSVCHCPPSKCVCVTVVMLAICFIYCFWSLSCL